MSKETKLLCGQFDGNTGKTCRKHGTYSGQFAGSMCLDHALAFIKEFGISHFHSHCREELENFMVKDKTGGDTRLSEITKATKEVAAGNVTLETVYQLILLGHRVYKAGFGLHESHVLDAIKKGLE